MSSSTVVYCVTANGRNSSSRPSLPYTFTSNVLCLGRIESRLAYLSKKTKFLFTYQIQKKTL
jgi:hypothetical protein